jgi:hypothetical protein
MLISSLSGGGVIVVKPGDSIAAAIAKAAPGTTILVEPGEYRERLTLKGDIRLLSLTPRGAVLRLPETATDEDAAVVANDVRNAEISGFRIVGDAATPLGVGVIARSSEVRLIDLEITGAARVAVDLGTGEGVMLLGSDIHDNSGAGLAIRVSASPRITHTPSVTTAAAPGDADQQVLSRSSSATLSQPDPQTSGAPSPRLGSTPNVNWFPDAPCARQDAGPMTQTLFG